MKTRSWGQEWTAVQDYVQEIFEYAAGSPAVEWWKVKQDEGRARIEVGTRDGNLWDFGPDEAVAFGAGLGLGLKT